MCAHQLLPSKIRVFERTARPLPSTASFSKSQVYTTINVGRPIVLGYVNAVGDFPAHEGTRRRGRRWSLLARRWRRSKVFRFNQPADFGIVSGDGHVVDRHNVGSLRLHPHPHAGSSQDVWNSRAAMASNSRAVALTKSSSLTVPSRP